MVLIFWPLSILVVYFWFRYRQRRRIREILEYIDQMYHQNYRMTMKQDDFALLEDQIYKLFLELIEEREQTQAMAALQSQNLEDIAHQIKTPMTGISLNIKKLRQGQASSEKLAVLESQFTRLQVLSEQLLKLASLQVPDKSMQVEIIHSNELVDYALEILEEDMDVHSVQIIRQGESDLIEGDFYWLAESLINVLKNALQQQTTRKIIISLRQNPIYHQIEIEDDGGGIDEDSQSKIFQRFYKQPDSNGFGLGLAIAKEVMLKHHGDLEVMNTDQGAKFTFKFYHVTSLSH
ncbi:HAMP domain-containing histidine kinase [Ignavigranum ruoffiae]|uniref:sensor histidine kinase n=1 Tax=Ignavigranum ruoffiae TaxID=89093 RepID=UPI00206B3A76|nr:HAMP domain-containing sensor histidine kinase [Ignavigranum ruoffiae]UPQ85092.1 HAMP domain-containing histidine kinase [Ignavigranum ruoffiae]